MCGIFKMNVYNLTYIRHKLVYADEVKHVGHMDVGMK